MTTKQTQEIEKSAIPQAQTNWQADDQKPESIVLEIKHDKLRKEINLDFQQIKKHVIGRGDEQSVVDIDMTPYNAVECGVSRYHATLFEQTDGVYIEDTGSTNGTRINGFALQPQRPYRLRHGDELELGRLRVVVRFIR